MTDHDRPAPSKYKRSIESLQQIARLAQRLTGLAGVTSVHSAGVEVGQGVERTAELV